jgi:hypothetical protein
MTPCILSLSIVMVATRSFRLVYETIIQMSSGQEAGWDPNFFQWTERSSREPNSDPPARMLITIMIELTIVSTRVSELGCMYSNSPACHLYWHKWRSQNFPLKISCRMLHRVVWLKYIDVSERLTVFNIKTIISLMVETVNSSETSVSFYLTTEGKISEDSHLNTDLSALLRKCRKFFLFSKLIFYSVTIYSVSTQCIVLLLA